MKTQYNQILNYFCSYRFRAIFLIAFLILTIDIDAARRRRFQETPQKEAVATENIEQKKETTTPPSPQEEPNPNVKSQARITKETQDRLKKIRQQLLLQIQNKQIAEMEKTIDSIPVSLLNKQEIWLKKVFIGFKEIEQDVQKNASQFFKESDLSPDVQKSLNRLYREAKFALLTGKKDIARDLLIHMLYLHRRNAKAKKSLELFLNLPTGAYKVENIASKYWELSSIHFYGGQYIKVLDDLSVYSLIDTDNPETYERMGSAYYMLGEISKAIEIWNSALFLDPSNSTLEYAIAKAKKYEIEQKQERKQRRQVRRSKTTKNLLPGTATQLLGVFPNRTKAYNYAQKLKSKGLTAYVEELENGKWSVKSVIQN